MSKKRLLSFLLCASLGSASTVFSQSAEQWRRLPGPSPEGDSIKVLFSQGDYLFAGTHNGIFRSTDQGQSWKSVNLPETEPSITSFTAVGETIFAGSSAWPMFRSTDNGLTWTRMEVPEDVGALLRSEIPLDITALAAIGGSLFAGTKCSSHAPMPCGIYRSNDNGKNWTRVHKGSIHLLAVIGAELFASSGYGSALRSSDLGTTWTEINVSVATPYGPANDISYQAFAAIGKQLFVGTNYGVFVSTDQGMNWRPINNGLPSHSYSKASGKYVKSFSKDGMRYVKALAVSGDALFAGFASQLNWGVFRFDSQSQSWTEVNNGLSNLEVNTFADSGGRLFVGTEAGVWVTSDNGESWKSANSGMNGRHGVGEMAVRDNRLLVQAFGGVYASTDNGNAWTRVKDSIDPTALQIPPEWGKGGLNKEVNCLVAINDVVIAGTGGGVFRSVDRGQTWEGASQGLPNGELGSLAPSINTLAVIGAKIYAGVEDCGLFISEDLGRSWTEASRNLRELTVIGLISKGEKLFAATSEDGVFVSLDQGRHWKATGAFFSGKEILSLAGIGDHLLAGTTNGIYLSTDEGQNWTASKTDFTDLYANRFVVSGAKIFVGTNNGLLVSSDQGRSWTKLGVIETGRGSIGHSLEIYALAVSGTNLFAGTGGEGVFLSTDDGRSWSQLGGNLLQRMTVSSLAVSGMDILAGCDDGRIYLSPDLGRRWAMVNAWIAPPRKIAPGIFTDGTKILHISVVGETHLIVGRDDGLFVSTNRGQTWRPTGVTREIYSLSVIGSAIFAGGAGGVLISKDNGRSWAPSVVGLNNPYPVQAFAVKGDRIYVAQQGVYVSSDGGRSWTPINDGLPELRIAGLVVNDTHIFVRTYQGWLFTRRL